MIIYMMLLIAQAQGDTLSISLAAARSRALEANPTLLAERAEVRAQQTEIADASGAFLPTVRFEMTGVRTTDPVAVFGVKLRQGVFSGNDLALASLNDPSGFTGFGSAAVVEMPVIAPGGWFGYTAAKRGAEARDASASRMSGATVYIVSQAYLEAQLAAHRAEALESNLEAVRAHVHQAELLHQQGLVTGLDARLASLRVADLEVRRLAAEAEAANARSRLRALLAVPESTVLVLTDALDDLGPAPACADPGASCSVEARGDLRALEAGREAANEARRSAWAAQLPQVGVFGGLTYNGHDTPWGSGSGDWTMGVAVRWNAFPALGGVAAVRKAAAEHEAAGARYDAALRSAEVEVVSAERMLGAAREGSAVAARAAAEAREALAQAEVRYRAGSAPITELLDVQSAATDATLTLLTARRDVLLAQAALTFAYGVNDR
jgi:outer membrane protein